MIAQKTERASSFLTKISRSFSRRIQPCEAIAVTEDTVCENAMFGPTYPEHNETACFAPVTDRVGASMRAATEKRLDDADLGDGAGSVAQESIDPSVEEKPVTAGSTAGAIDIKHSLAELIKKHFGNRQPQASKTVEDSNFEPGAAEENTTEDATYSSQLFQGTGAPSDAVSDVLKDIEDDQNAVVEGPNLEFCLDQFADDGGAPDPVSFASDGERAEDTGTSELGMDFVSVAPDMPFDKDKESRSMAHLHGDGSSETAEAGLAVMSAADPTEDELIPEIAAIEAADIVEEVVKITDFDSERDIIGVFCSKTLDGEIHRPITTKLNVARIKDGSGQVILLDGVHLAHVVCERSLRFKDVALLGGVCI